MYRREPAEGRKKTCVYMDAQLYKEALKWCIDHDTSYSAMVEELITKLLEDDEND